ncbi:MAG TPA: GtrA family protein [Bacillales bacterium]|nr:GtrA family protein [Bacillales bacterium]
MRKKRWIRAVLQYGQYSIIGISCGLIDLGSLNLFLVLWPTDDAVLLALFNTIAYGLAVLNSYIWNSRYTFRSGARHSRAQMVYFVLQALLALGVSNLVFILGVWTLEAFEGVPEWMIHNTAKGLSMFCSATTSFFLMKFVVFRKRKKSWS